MDYEPSKVQTLVSRVTFFALAFFLSLSSTPLLAATANTSSSKTNPSRTKFESVNMPSWEVKTAPIVFVLQWYTLDVAYRFNSHISFGPSLVLYNGSSTPNMFLLSQNGQAFGYNLNYYFKSAQTNTLYLSQHSYAEKYKVYPHSTEWSERDGYRSNAAIGYQWVLKYFNMQLGGGGEYRHHNVITHAYSEYSSKDNVSSVDDRVLPFVEFKTGLSF